MNILPGIYRHYTGLLVQVLGVGQHTESKEELVIYITLSAKAVNHLRARPLTMFKESVMVKGKKMPRFTYLGYEVPKEEERKPRTPLGQFSDLE